MHLHADANTCLFVATYQKIPTPADTNTCRYQHLLVPTPADTNTCRYEHLQIPTPADTITYLYELLHIPINPCLFVLTPADTNQSL